MRALVVGGTHGIGAAIVDALRARDIEVVATGRRGGDGAVTLDVTNTAAISALAARTGPLDALFVNAGLAELEPITDVTPASFDRQFAVTARGAYFTMQNLAPRVRDGGAIVVTTSIANLGGTPGMSVYAAAKAAARSMVSGFAAELLPRRVRVNAVSPGFVGTPTMGIEGATADERAAFAEEGAHLTPLGRIGTPAEVAAAALFLAFDATFTTGVELPVDGGLAQGLEAPQGDEHVGDPGRAAVDTTTQPHSSPVSARVHD